MIDKAKAKELALSMGRLDFFPTDKGTLAPLVSAIESAETLQAAERAVASWLAESTQAPKPAEMRRLLGTMRRSSRICPKCCDTGLLVQSGTFRACGCMPSTLRNVSDWVGREAR